MLINKEVVAQIQSDKTVPANKPDVILRHNVDKWCKLIEVSVPARNVGSKNINDSGHSWHIESYATFNKRKFKEETMQEITLCETVHILRKEQQHQKIRAFIP